MTFAPSSETSTHKSKANTNRTNFGSLRGVILGYLNVDRQHKVDKSVTKQKINAYLKELADLCGISKVLSFHVARHTFATTVTMMNGVPIKTVSKMLGHKNIKSTQHYARIVDQKVGEDMELLSRRLGTRLELAN